MAKSRPSPIPPGTLVGAHYKVEGLVRLAERRMFYRVNDDRDDLPQRKCWGCGYEKTARGEKKCGSCGTKMVTRRFLMSARWEHEKYDVYERFVALKLEHPGIVTPVDCFRHEGVMMSLIPYTGEGLLVDEAAPLANRRIFDVAQRVAGTVAFLHLNGVTLLRVTQANVLIFSDNSICLFDLQVDEVVDHPITSGDRSVGIQSIAAELRRYCDVEAEELRCFLRGVAEEGTCPNPAAFGRALEQRFDSLGREHYPELIAGMSDVGLVRNLNEDNWGWAKLSDTAKLYVVADGMGGHDAGEVASQIAVDYWCKAAGERVQKGVESLDVYEEIVGTTFVGANNAIKDDADSRGTDMGTTLVGALVLDDNTGFVANVGDSRAYLWRQDALHQISKDHSLVASMVERGRITAEEALTHPHSNILLRTVGTERDVDVDIFRVEFQRGDRIIICSDGLWGEVLDGVMENILNTYSDPRIAARELVRAAHNGGGKDNVTLVIVTIP